MKRPLSAPRVLLIGPSFEGGGAQIRFRNLARGMFGGTVDVATLLRCAVPSSFEPSQRIWCLGWSGELSYPRITLSLRRRIGRERYDVVVGFGRYPNLLAFYATRFFVQRPGTVLLEVTRPWAQATRPGGDSPIKRRVVGSLVRRAYSQADVLAANSRDGAQECVAMYGVNPRRTARVPNIIDPQQVRAASETEPNFPWPNTTHTLVTTARLVRSKAVDSLIKCLPALVPDFDCSAIIVGDGPELGSLQLLARKLGVEERVSFVGWQDNPLPTVGRSTVFVLTTQYEGMPNSLLEAMFLNTPVVTSFWGSDARDICRMGAALGFEPGDVTGLTAAVRKALASSDTRSKLVQKAAEYRNAHSTAHAIPTYERLIEAVASRRPLDPELLNLGIAPPTELASEPATIGVPPL